MLHVKRCGANPLIVPGDVAPSRPDFKVDGVFNCGVTKYGDETILLCRVAESVVSSDPDVLEVPVVVARDGCDRVETIRFDKKDPQYDFSDSRTVFHKKPGPGGRREVAALTSLSHLRVARSRDGVAFTVDSAPSILPTARDDAWGMEDPRITKIGGTYYINYSCVTPDGVGTALLSTADFVSYERLGVIFAPENKDVTIFPEKIGGVYYAFNRPVPSGFGSPNIWLAQSPDLIHWGRQRLFSTVQGDGWEGGRVGGGAVPFKTEEGWLVVYHAADPANRYCLGTYLLDAADPSKVLGKLREPLLQPEADYEENGFFGGVVFTCGVLAEGDNLAIYYGAADDKICRADVSISALLENLRRG